ncbi:polysaccharide deacetylase family protein [Paenibacillus sp. sgz500958]|uniref:polysaccharide deacetylase family protein n=1 Tax=Paenibacillus sp. sgz500958 TaxID=3242475 RepID=UPI0036D40A05
METTNSLMIELLSLGHELNGYRMEIGLFCNSGTIQKEINIDEYTYSQLNLLGPFTSHRIRLSLYPKWDPFRQTYYSTLVKINHSFNETLYYDCSEDYAQQLLQLKKQVDDGFVVEPDKPSEATVLPLIPEREPSSRIRSGVYQFGRIALRCVISTVILLFMSLRLEGDLFGDSMSMHEESAAGPGIIKSSSLTTTYAQSASILAEAATPSQHPDPSPKPAVMQNLSYTEIEMDDDKYEFTLPEGYVALTFDDGPSRYTNEIVDILVKHGMAATFLFVGKNVQNHPGEVQYAAGHEMAVGNHSWDHGELTKNTVTENRVNLTKANQALEKITGKPVTVFRPPYGAINDGLGEIVLEQHMKVLLWNRDPEDWNVGSPEEIVQYFHHTDPSGGIYLLHEKKVTLEALPEIIDYLKSKKLKFAVFK